MVPVPLLLQLTPLLPLMLYVTPGLEVENVNKGAMNVSDGHTHRSGGLVVTDTDGSKTRTPVVALPDAAQGVPVWATRVTVLVPGVQVALPDA